MELFRGTMDELGIDTCGLVYDGSTILCRGQLWQWQRDTLG